MGRNMVKGVVFCLIFFIFGLVISSHLNVSAETRLALPDSSTDVSQKIPFDAIKVYPDGVSIDYSGLKYAKVASNSMAPLITNTSTVLEKSPSSSDDIAVGDVISFYEPSVDGIVLHMVVEILNENGEISYRTKGTANPNADPWIVQYSNVKGILVGVLK